MVSLRRHFVPNPVAIDSTGFQANRRTSLFFHTRYDEVYRLIGTDRGTLDLTGTPHIDGTPSLAQDWTLDALGNFAALNDNGTPQTRATNAANEIQSVTTGGNPTNLTYDDAGNLVNDGTLKYRYDAWNRQVAVKKANNTPVAEYEFDGLNRRIEKSVYDSAGTTIAFTTDYFLNENWQVLEERQSPIPNPQSLVVVTQYAWDISYIDAPVCRFRDGNADGDTTDPNETLYYTWDANHNITSLVGQKQVGQEWVWYTVERYVYDPYGKATICAEDWTARPDTAADLNSATGDESAFGNEILFAAYRYDPETALFTTILVGCSGNYSVRERIYVTMLCVFSTTDPIEGS